MKTKLTVIGILTILVSACTTGTYMTKAYDDDIYFSPADIPPVAIVNNEATVKERSAQSDNNNAKDKKIILSQIDRNADGSASVNNYIYQQDQKNANSDHQSYNMNDQELVNSDTTQYYNDDDVKTVINNYYEDNNDDLDFSYRIGRFHNPYYFNPFYDDWNYGFYSPWYSGYYGWNYGWGYDSWYGGFGYPYSYYGYYSPFAYGLGFGLGGYWGYGGYGGYYNGYYGGGYNYHRNNDNVRFGRSSDFSNYAGGGSSTNRTTGSSVNRSVLSEKSGSLNQTNSNGATRLSRSVSGSTTIDTRSGVAGVRREAGTQISTQSSTINGSVRRSYEPSTTGRTYNQGQAIRQSQNYTPSYNRPRVISQSNYNSSSYTRPSTTTGSYQRSAVRSSSSNSQTYSQPRSSSSMRQTYRSSSSYSSGSSSSPSRSSATYSSPSRSSSSYSSGSSYSAPARSSGSSYSGGGGSSSSGSSSGGSGGRGGNGGRR
jgi:hypothetical protein